jgi:hypothetical protein
MNVKAGGICNNHRPLKGPSTKAWTLCLYYSRVLGLTSVSGCYNHVTFLCCAFIQITPAVSTEEYPVILKRFSSFPASEHFVQIYNLVLDLTYKCFSEVLSPP